MKKYITISIIACMALSLGSIAAESSQASFHQQLVEGALCHQQDPGVKICPTCKGSGSVGKCITCSRCKGKGIVKG